jgi:predicted Rossmann-fold nucleotide-binding protein
VREFPVVLYDTAFWTGLIEWLSEEPLAEHLIAGRDLGLVRITDSAEEVCELVTAPGAA